MKPSITAPPLAELPLGAQTAYAQLLDAALAADLQRGVADLRGSFARKTVKGATYWYYQVTEPSGKLNQFYVGPDSEAVARLREQKGLPGASARLGPLARSAAALGCTELVPRHARVLSRLSEYGYFRAGGVLIGTHAFLAFGNMLGVRWSGSERTEDVDFAHAGKSVSLALPTNVELNADAAIQSLGMGFLPIPSLGEQGFNNPRLCVNLEAPPFQEYLLEDLQQAVVFAGDTVVLVNVPSPARYALHKLIVLGERSGAYATKSAKDLRQAGALLARLKELRKSDVDRAWKDLVSRGKGWRTRVKPSLGRLDKAFPELGVVRWLRLPKA